MDVARISRRTAIARLSGVLATVGISAACTSRAPLPTATVAPAQKEQDTALIFGIVQPILTAAPYPNAAPGVSFRRNVWDTLVSLDANRRPVPELAESWTISDDRRTTEFKIRQGVTFHSGRPFTAEDVRWNLEFLQDPKNQANAADGLKDARIVILDKFTLQVRAAEALPQLLSVLSSDVILDPESDPVRSPAGTGPFKIEELRPGDEMRLVRHAGYWRRGLPHLARLTIRVIPDPSTLLVNLESGAISVAYPVPLNEVKRLQTGAHTTVTLNPMAGNQAYLVRADEEPFTDRRVRQALHLAIDRQRCVQSALRGFGTPTSVVWPQASPAWDATSDTLDLDLERASQLLAEAGLGGGFETSITASRTFSPDMFAFHQIFQADLAKIGVKANLAVVDENVRTKFLAERNFSGLIHYGAGGGDVDPAVLLESPPFRVNNNISHYESPEYTRLVQAGRLASDDNQRLAIYHDLTRRLKDEAFFLPVANPLIPHGLRREVQGLAFTVGLPAAVQFANVSVG